MLSLFYQRDGKHGIRIGSFHLLLELGDHSVQSRNILSKLLLIRQGYGPPIRGRRLRPVHSIRHMRIRSVGGRAWRGRGANSAALRRTKKRLRSEDTCNTSKCKKHATARFGHRDPQLTPGRASRKTSPRFSPFPPFSQEPEPAETKSRGMRLKERQHLKLRENAKSASMFVEGFGGGKP